MVAYGKVGVGSGLSPVRSSEEISSSKGICRNAGWQATLLSRGLRLGSAGLGNSTKRDIVAGLAVYARHNGSFAVWDPAQPTTARHGTGIIRAQHIALSREDVWNGILTPIPAERVCNGLVTDWVLWQVGGDRYANQFGALVECLRTLSPSDKELLEVGEPMHLHGPQEIPTLVMSYGNVPITIASAAVERVAALAYMLVWTWFEHIRNASAARRPTQKAIVLLVDEVEAHLHPRWQRMIVPAMVKVVEQLAPDVVVQVHLATHSPMVMASAETILTRALTICTT